MAPKNAVSPSNTNNSARYSDSDFASISEDAELPEEDEDLPDHGDSSRLDLSSSSSPMPADGAAALARSKDSTVLSSNRSQILGSFTDRTLDDESEAVREADHMEDVDATASSSNGDDDEGETSDADHDVDAPVAADDDDYF